MIPLFAPELDRTVSSLKKYDPESAIPLLAGLLTMPELEANTMRIETLVHLSVAHCQGNTRIRFADIDVLLNGHLGKTQIATFEDPPEDVFVTNIETDVANFLIFQSIWASNDYYLQVVMDVLGDSEVPSECRDLLVPALALLTLSDRVAKRVGLERWKSTPSTPNRPVTLPLESRTGNHAKAVTFTVDDLNALNIERDWLTPFVFEYRDRHTLGSETIGNTSLERYPLVELDGRLILALPHAVSPAIRRFVLGTLERTGHLEPFSAALAEHQAEQVYDGLWELKDDSEPLKLIPPRNRNIPPFHAQLLKYDSDKYIHVVLLHDYIDGIYEGTLGSFQRFTPEQEENLLQYLSDVSSYCSSFPGFTEGFTLIVFGGLGRGIAVNTPDLPDKWYFSLLSTPDLLTLGTSGGRPVRSYLKFIKYLKWTESKGVVFADVNGDFNLYCCWRSNNYRLVPHDMPAASGSVIIAEADFVQSTREKVRVLADRHALQTIDGIYVPAIRANKDSYFPSSRTLPIYVSLSHLVSGKLAGAVETPRGPSWLLLTEPIEAVLGNQFGYHAFDEFINIYARLVFKIEEEHTNLAAGPISVRLNFKDVTSANALNETPPNQPDIILNLKKKTAEIMLPHDMLKYFEEAENVGEKMIVRCITKAILCLHQVRGIDQIDEGYVTKTTNHVIGDSDIRIIHSFAIMNPLEFLQMRRSNGCIEVSRETLNFYRMSLSQDCNVKKNGSLIESKSECNKFLHCVVDKILKRLQMRLKAFDRSNLISRMCELYEACLSDREYWRRTARATTALYGDTDDVLKIFGRQATDRTEVSIAIRAVLEIAICECPVSGGKEVSSWLIDDLLADAHLLMETAMHSDAIHKNLAVPKIVLQKNGEFLIDTSAYQRVVDPFVKACRAMELNEAVEKYGELYRSESPNDSGKREDLWSARFVRAFQAEFGLTPQHVIDCFSQLLEMAIECDSLVVKTTFGEIMKRLTRRSGLASASCEAFIQTFGLFHRPTWDKSPAGFTKKDIYPWRFRRRLSSTVRPIFVFGQQDNDQVIFGIGALWLGCRYLLQRSEDGLLPNDFYRKREMKEYIGSVNDKRGHAFADSVAQEMRKKGWRVENEVKMSSLGASAELGDVDVLAWKPDGNIRIIECKRLRLARTIVEVAEICERFQGEAKDELAKHIRRVQWIKNNPASLKRIIGYIPDSDSVDDRLVTSVQVPMTYLGSLPIDAAKVGPLEEM